MSLYVKGAKMPKECMTCPACQGDECWFEEDRPQIPDILNHRRRWCRLVDVKTPHGRLIDADRLIAMIESAAGSETNANVPLFAVIASIKNAPTVIEAES